MDLEFFGPEDFSNKKQKFSQNVSFSKVKKKKKTYKNRIPW